MVNMYMVLIIRQIFIILLIQFLMKIAKHYLKLVDWE